MAALFSFSYAPNGFSFSLYLLLDFLVGMLKGFQIFLESHLIPVKQIELVSQTDNFEKKNPQNIVKFECGSFRMILAPL